MTAYLSRVLEIWLPGQQILKAPEVVIVLSWKQLLWEIFWRLLRSMWHPRHRYLLHTIDDSFTLGSADVASIMIPSLEENDSSTPVLPEFAYLLSKKWQS
jgi:hypothetical protein